MIRLDNTTRKLQVVLAGAITTNQLPVVLSWSDKTTSSYTGGSTVSNTNSTTAVDICAAPAASTIRDIDSVSINNIDTVMATVTVRYNDNATLYTIVKIDLEPGDQLLYTHGQGWKCIDFSGASKPTGQTPPLDRDQTWTGSQRGTLTTDNDLSFDLNASNNFFCTPTAGGALTFTNHTSGQSGFILFVNSTNYAITAAATTKIDSTFLNTISSTGTYLISYLDNGTNTYCTATKALS